MTKAEIIVQIKGKIHIGKSGLSIAYILGTKFWMERMRNLIGPAIMDIQSNHNLHTLQGPEPTEIVKRYEDAQTMNNDVVNIIRLTTINMLTQVYELIREYSKQKDVIGNDQYATLQSQHWFHIIRNIRNAFNHNFRFIEIKNAQQPNYIDFSDKRLIFDESLNNIEVDFDNLPIKYCFELAEMMLSSFEMDFG